MSSTNFLCKQTARRLRSACEPARRRLRYYVCVFKSSAGTDNPQTDFSQQNKMMSTPPPLPADWIVSNEPQSGADFYYNTRTGESTWFRPGPLTGIAAWESAMPMIRGLLPSLSDARSQTPSREERKALRELATMLETALAAAQQAEACWAEESSHAQEDTQALEHAAAAASDVVAQAASMKQETDEIIDVLSKISLGAASVNATASAVTATLPSALAVGDPVCFKRSDRTVGKGVVNRTEVCDGNRLYWIDGQDGEAYERWPAASVKLDQKCAPSASAPEGSASASLRPAKVEFRLSSKPKRPTKMTEPPRAPTHAAVQPPAAADLGVPRAPPRMPRIIAVVDTNALLPRSGGAAGGASGGAAGGAAGGTAGGAGERYLPIGRDYLLQGFLSRGCDVLLATQVVVELDGLKNSDDPGLAAAARRANALLAAAASAREPWLLFEEEGTLMRVSGGVPAGSGGGYHAASMPVLSSTSTAFASSSASSSSSSALAPDEKIIACAVAFAVRRRAEHPGDRVVVATSDRNATVRAVAAGVEAMPLESLRAQAAERDRAWRAAYCQSAASTAVERAAAAAASTGAMGARAAAYGRQLLADIGDSSDPAVVGAASRSGASGGGPAAASAAVPRASAPGGSSP